MRKRLVSSPQQQPGDQHEWLDLAEVAEVEVTSEDPDFPVEDALLPTDREGWRAAEPGRQTIRLIFVDPQPIHLIQLEFQETRVERTQEFVLSWSTDRVQPLSEIRRQQWNFSPDGATGQTEQIHVDLPSVAVLELTVIPDIGGGEARGTLARWRVA
jgi:hypothetical protein